tara:strand:+ start:5468 stop:6235 length:768 start_codon:yes stop_codon:yes gene_type:complete
MLSIKVLVIGKNSLLSNCFKRYTKIKKIKFISYKEVKKEKLKNFTHIINFSLDPMNFIKEYESTHKLDKKICNLIKNEDCIYIMPSSRLVYSKSRKNFYGKNKKKIEKDIVKFQKKYLILRIGTILTFDLSYRNLFISRVLKSLKKDGLVTLDISKYTYKDFITSNLFVEILDSLIQKNATGIYNLSTNIPISVDEILKNIIKGFGRGKIIYKKIIKKKYSFLLNNNKLKKEIKFKMSKKYILDYCINLGKQLSA